jgi:hypothetical protein
MKKLTPLLTLIVLACDPLAGPDYPGEPMLELQGEVVSALENTPPTEIALAWIVNDDVGEFAFHPEATTVPVEGTFPAGFTMRLFHPPPAAAFDTPIDEGFNTRVALGFILALREGSGRDLTNLRPEDLLGVSDNQFLVYAEGSVPELGFSPGYQLIAAIAEDDPRVAEAERCFDEVFDEIVACEDSCFFGSDACFESCGFDDDRCFQSCDSSLNGCLGDCNVQFEPQIGECEQLNAGVEVAQPDTLRVRMFENASAEEIWSLFRPEDCNAVDQAHAACVSTCDFDDEPCFEQCAAEYEAFSCGAPAGRCEALYLAWDDCFEGCLDAEFACHDGCFGDELCEQRCFEDTDACIVQCDQDIPFDGCDDDGLIEPPPPPEDRP